MISERPRRVRETYVSEISPWYNGLVHVVVMYAAATGAIAWCLSRMNATTWEWLIAIPVFIAGNFAEWAMHKYCLLYTSDAADEL